MADIQRLIDIMARLRAPEGGCPWDLEQTFESIAPYTIEEAYEVDDAIRRGDLQGLRDELGDLLLQVVFHAQMADEMTDEEGRFDFGDVVEAVCDKLVRRHPHVFGDARIDSAEAQTDAWEQQKAEERERRGETSVADGVPSGLPALLRSRKLLSRARRAGFELPGEDATVEELRAALRHLENDDESDLKPLLWSVARLAHARGVDPERALRESVAGFERELRSWEAGRAARAGRAEGAERR